ncbi:hypothetical protein [Nocardioides sp.]|uniref:hypothetical protein n=1 Tax=Nocardioides sp. TaxID=35761 RepID=UPI0026046F29|nr:hypothetical protein [Nocardioides sp.]MCW2737948.1 hypothetical protein [Nocardioides sp.]
MADHTDNQFKAAIAALREVVAPAVNPHDPAAREQLQLVIDQLEFVRQRVGLLDSRHRLELVQQLDMVERLAHAAKDVRDPSAAEISDTVTDARAVLADPIAKHEDLAAQQEGLARLVPRILEHAPDEHRQALDRLVVQLSGSRVTFERSWYAPLGFDPDPESLPSVDSLLAEVDLGGGTL